MALTRSIFSYKIKNNEKKERIGQDMSEKSKVIKIDGQELAGKAAELREAGITGVIVRLDTLNHTRYHDISEGKSLQTVIDGINGAIDQQLAVRLNVAITEGFNDDEVLDFLQLTLQHRCDIVFLPTIDYGILKEKMPALRKIDGASGEVEMYKYPMAVGRIGFIKD